MEVREKRHKVVFNNFPEDLIEFYREAIRTRSLVVFHLEDGIFHLRYGELTSKQLIFLSGHLRNDLNSIFLKCNIRNIRRPEKVLIKLSDIALKLGITDNSSLIIFKFINMLFLVFFVSHQMEESHIIISF